MIRTIIDGYRAQGGHVAKAAYATGLALSGAVLSAIAFCAVSVCVRLVQISMDLLAMQDTP